MHASELPGCMLPKFTRRLQRNMFPVWVNAAVIQTQRAINEMPHVPRLEKKMGILGEPDHRINQNTINNANRTPNPSNMG